MKYKCTLCDIEKEMNCNSNISIRKIFAHLGWRVIEINNTLHSLCSRCAHYFPPSSIVISNKDLSPNVMDIIKAKGLMAD